LNIALRLFDGYAHTSPALAEAVREAQSHLRRAGYDVDVDGKFGPMTEEAVEAFQGTNNILVDGVVNSHVWAAFEGKALGDGRQFQTTYLPETGWLKAHSVAAEAYREHIVRAAKTADVPVAIIVGIGSRESGWGLSDALRPKGPAGTGDFARRRTPKGPRTGDLPPDGGGFGRGLMQIDYDAHEFARTGPWQVASENIAYGATVLRDNRIRMKRKYSDLGWEGNLRAAVAAYNCGAGRVDTALKFRRDIDFYTAHRDYSADVLNRAGWFQNHEW
jgi:soluble lytic murein transglycosylase-like protein